MLSPLGLSARLRKPSGLAAAAVLAALAAGSGLDPLRGALAPHPLRATAAQDDAASEIGALKTSVEEYERLYEGRRVSIENLYGLLGRLTELRASKSFSAFAAFYYEVVVNRERIDDLWAQTDAAEPPPADKLRGLLGKAKLARDAAKTPEVEAKATDGQKAERASLESRLAAAERRFQALDDALRKRLAPALAEIPSFLTAVGDSLSKKPLDAPLPAISGETDAVKLSKLDAYRAQYRAYALALAELAGRYKALAGVVNALPKLSPPGGAEPHAWVEKEIDPAGVKDAAKLRLGAALNSAAGEGSFAGVTTEWLRLEKLAAKAAVQRVGELYLEPDSARVGSLGDAGAVAKQIRDVLAALDAIVQGTLTAPEDVIVKSDRLALIEGRTELRRVQEGRQTALALLDPTGAADATHWVTDYVRLFYFTDVKRLLKTLNPTTRVANPEDASFADRADQAEKDLLDAEKQRALDVANANELAEQLGGLEDALADANRKAAATFRRRQAAENEKNRIDRLDELDARKKTDLKLPDTATAIAQDQNDLKSLQTQYDAASAEDKPKIQASIDDKKADLAKLQDKQKRDQATADAADARIAARRSRKEAADRAATNAANEDAAAQKAAADAEDVTNGVRAKITEARGRLVTLRQRVNENRLATRLLALEEVRAFAKARDNAEFYVAPPGGNATDSVRRVAIYGYGDNNTLLIRGDAEDVEAAKEVIAQFDRPSPQARISLYTLQINGVASSRGSLFVPAKNADPINDALNGVHNELRDLRTRIAVVQEALRASITREVARAAAIAGDSLKDGRLREHPRLARSCFYSPEVRSRLGFEWNDPGFDAALRKRYVADDLLTLRDCLTQAQESDCTDARLRLLYFVAADAYGRVAHAVATDADVAGVAGLRDLVGLFRRAKELLPNDPQKVNRLALQQAVGQSGLNKYSPGGEYEQIKQIADLLQAGSKIDGPRRSDIDDYEYVTRLTMPDPVRVTTLGEMMFVLSLAGKESRERVLNGFALELSDRLRLMGPGSDTTLGSLGSAITAFIANAPAPATGAPKPGFRNDALYPQFLRTILNGNETRIGTDPVGAEAGSNQAEVLLAVESKARENIASEIRATLDAIAKSRSLNAGASEFEIALRKRYTPFVGWLASRLNIQLKRAGETDRRASSTDWSAFDRGDATQGVYTATGEAVLDRAVAGSRANGPVGLAPTEDGLAQDRFAWQLSDLIGTRNSLAQARPRVAAADEMIKRMILSAENDLDHFFVAPALENIRAFVRSKGVQLGILEQQSILATNRLVARLGTDANASATLAGATDFRDEASQLGSIVNQSKANSVTPGLTTAALGFGAASLQGKRSISPFGTAGLLGLIDILSAQDSQPRGEVYSLNSNGVFKVRPIFDPSGQVLRFKFDHVAQIYLQGPDGSSSRDVPRIERTTVNNEVQLSNLEFREIASYGLNSRIGTPDTKTGGVPILKDLPVIRDIPLLGYYSRRNASAATRQESLIFAQTSMYPTVSDIVDLMLDVIPATRLDRRAPEYLRASEALRGATTPQSNRPATRTNGKGGSAKVPAKP